VAGIAYCTRADLEARYGAAEIEQLLDRDGDGEEDAGRLDAAIGGATAELDARIGGATAELDARIGAAYRLPLDAPRSYPGLIDAACRLAREALHDDAPPEHVAEGARRARDRADGWRTGKYELVSDAGAALGRQPSGEDLAALEAQDGDGGGIAAALV